jgi:hypothetical protein
MSEILRARGPSHGLCQLRNYVISAEEVKIYKTSPRVYGLVSDHLGVPRGHRWRQELWVLDLLGEPDQASQRGTECNARCHGAPV